MKEIIAPKVRVPLIWKPQNVKRSESYTLHWAKGPEHDTNPLRVVNTMSKANDIKDQIIAKQKELIHLLLTS